MTQETRPAPNTHGNTMSTLTHALSSTMSAGMSASGKLLALSPVIIVVGIVLYSLHGMLPTV